MIEKKRRKVWFFTWWKYFSRIRNGYGYRTAELSCGGEKRVEVSFVIVVSSAKKKQISILFLSERTR